MRIKSITLTTDQIKNLKNQLKQFPESKLDYAYYSIKLPHGRISAYKSGKVVFQGEDALEVAKQFETKFVESAGSDEVGTGDYFGPVVVCACLVKENDLELLNTLSIMDSKGLSDYQIIEIAPLLIHHLKHSLLVLDNPTYNRVQKKMNLNAIKANMHQKAYDHLRNKVGSLPSLCVIDQFMDPKRYFEVLNDDYGITHLTFETKAENKYLAVACASIIARYTFLEALNQLSEKVQFDLPKGAGKVVDEKARQLLLQNPSLDFNQIAKLHFKNTERIFKQSQR